MTRQKIHYVTARGARFTECCRDREVQASAVTTKARTATCMRCVRLLAIQGLLSKVEFLDRKIRRLQVKRRRAAGRPA